MSPRVQYFLGWIFYFSILVAVGMYSSRPNLDVWWLNLADATTGLGYGDPTYFAAAATDISQGGWITEKTSWVFNLWPPGFVLLESLLLKLFGIDSPMPLILLFCCATLFSAVMMEMQYVLKDAFGFGSWLAPIIILAFPTTRLFILSSTGLVLGEWLAIGCFFYAVLLLGRRATSAMIFSGFLFAMAAYARSQYEFFLNVLLLVSISIFAVSYYLQKIKNGSFINVSKYLLISLATAQVLLLPWRLYHISIGHDGRWVYTAEYLVEASLNTNEALEKRGALFLVLGGVNVACHISPLDCGKNDARIYLKIFKNNSIEWIAAKLKMLPDFWFASDVNLTSPVKNNFVEGLFNLVFLLCFIASLALFLFCRKNESVQVWWGVSTALVFAHVFIIIFSHLEVRYFFFIKMYGVMSFILLLAEFKKVKFPTKRVKLNSSEG